MALAHRFSARLNLASPDDAERVEAHLSAVGLPWRMADIPGELPDAEALLGFITQETLTSMGMLDHVAVYLPQSYNFAGSLLIFPTSAVTVLDAESADVMAFIVSGGVTVPPVRRDLLLKGEMVK